MVISFDNSYTIFVISASRKTPDTVNAPCHFDAVITILVSHVRPIIFALFILAMCHSCYIYDPSQLVAAISTHLCWLCHSLSVAAWIGSTIFTTSPHGCIVFKHLTRCFLLFVPFFFMSKTELNELFCDFTRKPICLWWYLAVSNDICSCLSFSTICETLEVEYLVPQSCSKTIQF